MARKKSTQELLGISGFTKYGLAVHKDELLFFQAAPTNISVLSYASIETKIHHLMMVFSAMPEIELMCTDSCECFDTNKGYLYERIQKEKNPRVKQLLQKDIDMLDGIQMEMSTARQFMFIVRCRNMKPEQVFQTANRSEKVIAEQGFEVRRMKKEEIKRFLAIYFEASMTGEMIPDREGEELC